MAASLEEIRKQQQIEDDAVLAASLSGLAVVAVPSSSAVSVKQQQALAKVTAEYEQLCKMLPDVDSIGLQESNVHLFSQAGPIIAAFAYSQALDREYSLSRSGASIAVVCESILKVGSEIQSNLLADAERAAKASKIDIAAGLRSDAATIAASVAKVIGSVKAFSGVDSETGVALQDLLMRTWFLATLDVLVGSRTPEMVYRNLSLNIETGGGCIPGIIVRLEVPHIFCIRSLLECMIRGTIPIPPALSSAIIAPHPMMAFTAHRGSPPSTGMSSRAVPVRVASVPSISKPDAIAVAVAKRREFLTLKVKLGEFPGDVEATLKAHGTGLASFSLESLQEIIQQDCIKIEKLKGRIASQPKF